MSTIKDVLEEQIPGLRERIRTLVKEHGDKVISEVTVQQLFGGVRGVKCLLCETSLVDPMKGLIIRGIPISELTDRLPEEIFYLLTTGELPDKKSLEDFKDDLTKRAHVSDYVWNVLRDLPEDSHPMEMFNAAILVLESESEFRRQYSRGLKK
jgi:citrate synthase